jgi:hypothetical protein
MTGIGARHRWIGHVGSSGWHAAAHGCPHDGNNKPHGCPQLDNKLNNEVPGPTIAVAAAAAAVVAVVMVAERPGGTVEGAPAEPVKVRGGERERERERERAGPTNSE